jgi:uncharacterized protein
MNPAEVVLIGAVWWMAIQKLDEYAVQEWLWEMWRFVKQIIPLLLVGVFVAGMARALIPRTWIQTLAGRNTVLANLDRFFAKTKIIKYVQSAALLSE